MSNKGANRQRVVNEDVTNNGLDIPELITQKQVRDQAIKDYVALCLEKAVIKTRELRMAGMINKAGADEIMHVLILALSTLEGSMEVETVLS
ncbi:hypothetical protein D1872_81610 [compost metagenome]